MQMYYDIMMCVLVTIAAIILIGTMVALFIGMFKDIFGRKR